MSNDRPSHTVLADGSIFRIVLAGCQGVQLTIGAVTVRLPPGALSDLSATVDSAVRRLARLGNREGSELC